MENNLIEGSMVLLLFLGYLVLYDISDHGRHAMGECFLYRN